jgi:hypothetical protein
MPWKTKSGRTLLGVGAIDDGAGLGGGAWPLEQDKIDAHSSTRQESTTRRA